MQSNLDQSGRSELHYVAVDVPKENQEKEVNRLLDEGCDPNTQDKMGWTALHFAAQEWSLPVARVLLARGAKIDLKDSFGNTPLARAVMSSKGRGELITLFLENGAGRDVENNHGHSPLSMAETIANYDIKQFFK